MAIVIQLTDEVNDPENLFPYITPYGLASEQLATFYNNLKSAGYTLSQAHFNAYNKYINSLKSDNSWTKIKAIAPFQGSNINQSSFLLKSDTTTKQYTRLSLGTYQLTDSQLVKDVSGNSKYIKVPVMSTFARAFDTGKKFSDLQEKFGMTSFVKFATSSYNAANPGDRFMFGSNLSNDGTQHIGLSLSWASSTQMNLKARFRGLSNFSRTITTNETNEITSFRLFGQTQSGQSYMKAYVNGSLVYDVNQAVLATAIDDAQPIYLLAKSSIGGSNINQAFDGNFYFHIIDDGTLTDVQIVNLNNYTNTLLTELGKDL